MKEMIKKLNKEDLIKFGIGLILGILIMLLFYPSRIAELKNGEQVAATINKTNITADELYTGLKEHYSITVLRDLIDKALLDKKYKTLNKSELSEIEQDVSDYMKSYTEYYNKSESEILEMLGFETMDDFKEYITLDYKRNKAYREYISNALTESEIEEYYNAHVFGKSNVEHILVKTSETVTSEDAKNKATEILNKLKGGATWENVKSEYQSEITTESFAVNFYDNLERPFLYALTDLKDGEYTSSLVETNYGYHIILKENSEEKPTLKNATDNIKDILVDLKGEEDKELYEKTLIKIREENDLKIKDTELKKAYKEFIKKYED